MHFKDRASLSPRLLQCGKTACDQALGAFQGQWEGLPAVLGRFDKAVGFVATLTQGPAPARPARPTNSSAAT